jgi:peroxiredoxin
LKRILYILIFSFLFTECTFAQVTIQGTAKAYKGKELLCTRYIDYLSYELEELGKAKVDADGNFSFSFQLNESSQIQLHCAGSQGMMYADPNANYSILVNAPDSTNQNAYQKSIRIDFDTLLTYDINNLILDFSSRHDDFMFYNFNLVGNELFSHRLDTFKIYLSKVYKPVKHPYFANYVAYSIAETEMLGPPKKDENAFLKLVYAQYFLNKPVLYTNDKYMNFFNKFYSDIFKMISVSREMDLFRAVNYYGSPTLIKRVLQKDILLRDERICELAVLRSLGQEYYNAEFDKGMILDVLDSIQQTSKFLEHKTIAKNTKRRLIYLHNGSIAPDFTLPDNRDSTVSLSKLKGKFVYIMFWSTDNTISLNELKLMKGMYDKYKWDIEFVCINVDEDPKAMKDFLRKNSSYKWKFLYGGKEKDIREIYNVSTLPQFFLVDPEGVLLQAPALRPSPNGTFRSIDETFFYIYKKLHPKKTHIPGQKED